MRNHESDLNQNVINNINHNNNMPNALLVNHQNTFNQETDYVIKGKYVLKNYIKGGGFGDIFIAKHKDKNYEVAIKFVSKNKEITSITDY